MFRLPLRLILSLLAASVLVYEPSPLLAQQHRFQFQAPFVGQQITQNVRTTSQLNVTFQQAGQVVSQSARHAQSAQIRQITVLGTADQYTARVRVTYQRAEVSVADKEQAPQRINQPVAGKTYFVFRQDGNLVVTDEQGRTPPEAELGIVRANMTSIGRSNPLAQFLHGRSIAVGQTLDLPQHLARDLFNVDQGLGDVRSVTMTLKDVRHVAQSPCGLFAVAMAAISPADGRTALTIRGELLIEKDTCRTVSVDCSAPISLTETRGPQGAQFTVSSQGRLDVAIRATYQPGRLQ